MDLEHTSKFISLILRHRPEVIGIEIDEYGWADTDSLIEGINRSGKYTIDRKTLEKIVEEDEKQRYKISDDGKKIRANQGHSINVKVEMEKKEPPKMLYHGTGEQNVEPIRNNGIVPKSRLYVHLSKDEETAVSVGKRHGKPVVLKIKTGDMYKEGYEFFISSNGVWQTKNVPVKFIIFPD